MEGRFWCCKGHRLISLDRRVPPWPLPCSGQRGSAGALVRPGSLSRLISTSGGGDNMRAFSSIASITIHFGLAATVLLGSATSVRSNPTRPTEVSIVLPRIVSGPPVFIWAPSGPPTVRTDLGKIRIPDFTLQTRAPVYAPGPALTTSAAPRSDQTNGWVLLGSQEGPQVLTGPLPRYPELLRLAGIQGRGLLEAVVDTTGGGGEESILGISAKNAGVVSA